MQVSHLQSTPRNGSLNPPRQLPVHFLHLRPMSIGDQLVSAVLEFLEAAIHTVLKSRNVYSPSLFENRRLYGISVSQCRHPGVCSYIGTVLANLKVRAAPVSWTPSPWQLVQQLSQSCQLLLVNITYVLSFNTCLTGLPCCVMLGVCLGMQPLLLRDTLQEVVVVFNDADGSPISKCSFIVQVPVVSL